MKYKLKKILLLYLLSGMLFVSCSLEEDYATKKRYEEKMKISHVSFGELLKNKKFSTAYSKVLQQQSLTNKTVMEEQYQFTIANKPVKVIETESATSYTILINRAIDDVNSFENLIVQQLNSGETTANIIKYVPFQPATIESYFLNGDFNGNRTVTPIVYNDNLINSTNKDSNNSSTVCTTLCYVCNPNSVEYQTPHTPTNDCINMNADIQTTCEEICIPTYSGGDGSSSNPIDITGGGGTGGTTGEVETPPNDSGNNNPIVTAPVLELEEEEAPKKTPCEELKKLTKNPNYNAVNPYMGSNDKRIRTAIINMPNEITPTSEAGYSFIGTTNNQSYGPYANFLSPDASNHVYFNLHYLMYGYIHTHPNDGKHIPMFSLDDIYTLLEIAENFNANGPTGLNTSGNDLFTAIMVSKIGGVAYTYAIKIDDISKLQELKKLHPKGNGSFIKWERYGDRLNEKYKDDADGANGTQAQYEKTLLEFLKDEDLGVSLYQMEQVNFGTPNVYEIWKKVELNGDNPPKKTPCN